MVLGDRDSGNKNKLVAALKKGRDMLLQAGKKWGDVKVTILAQKVRAGAFDKIIAAIDYVLIDVLALLVTQ